EALLHEGELIIARLDNRQFEVLMHEDEIEELASFETNNLDLFRIKNLWDITRFNARAIQLDFDLLTANRTSAPISATNRILGEENIFMEPGARVEFATINATAGPVYIGKDAEIMEGALIRGPFAMGEHAVVKMGAKIYGATTLGPWCKVGGEVSNSVLFGYSNKGHDGFLGDSVIGEWCNIGADTNNSNLKNNYTEVKLWNYPAGRFIKTGQQFCGLFMGDHSKCGINTMFNTGTVVGVSANIFGDGFPRNFIPSFAWGGAAGFTTFKTDKAFETAEAMMRRRNKTLDTLDRVILLKVFEESAHWRAWEKADA
ncbi:MAG: glucose-1-phosphate thymidylyltransferase, partial [Bacteroidetes bacterium]